MMPPIFRLHVRHCLYLFQRLHRNTPKGHERRDASYRSLRSNQLFAWGARRHAVWIGITEIYGPGYGNPGNLTLVLSAIRI